MCKIETLKACVDVLSNVRENLTQFDGTLDARFSIMDAISELTNEIEFIEAGLELDDDC